MGLLHYTSDFSLLKVEPFEEVTVAIKQLTKSASWQSAVNLLEVMHSSGFEAFRVQSLASLKGLFSR